MNRDKTVIFDDERITQSLEAFVAETGNTAINEYTNGKGRWFASRDQAKHFLIDLLTKIIDDDMEDWIEQPLEARTVVMENNHATD